MTLRDQTIGLCIFFPVLTTITVFLRVFVRTRLCKGAFGWDDVALLVTWVSIPGIKPLDCRALIRFPTGGFAVMGGIRLDVDGF